MVNIYFVGTIHIDLKGPSRLEKFLNIVRPDTIGIECREKEFVESQKLLSEREFNAFNLTMAMMSKYPKNVVKDTIDLFRVMGYEIDTLLDYRKQNSATTLIPCDDYSDEFKAWHESNIFGSSGFTIIPGFRFSVEELVDYTKRINNINVEKIYNNIESSIEGNPSSNPTFKKALIYRDNFAENKIREAIVGSQHTFVYVGGIGHIFGSYQNNLFERLKDFNPVRLKLNSVDQF